MNDVNEGSIVTIEGVIFDEGGNAFSGGSTYSFSNADGNGIIYIRASNPLSGEPIPLAQVSITGIVSEFNGFQLLPRGPQDVEITSSLFITENVSFTWRN